MSTPPLSIPTPHSPAEDAYAIFIGCTLVVTGLVFLQSGGLVTGGVAGLALLLSYRLHVAPGALFMLLNLPFFLLAARRMGRPFLVKTLAVSIGVALLSSFARRAFRIVDIHPGAAAIVGGTLIGMGTLAVARHAAGVGGIGILVLWLNKHRGWNAGRTQLAIDAGIIALSALVSPIWLIGWSALSALAISGVLIISHRPGRYTGY